MKDSASIRKRLDEIKMMSDMPKALSALADLQFEIGMSACAERKILQNEIEGLRRVITGNGKPELSLVTRVRDVETCVTAIKSDLTEIKLALLGDMRGNRGVLGRVKDNEKHVENMVKVMWIVVGAVVVQIVAAVLGLL